MTAQLAAHGARVVVADVDGAQAVEHAQHLTERGADVLGVELDIGSEASVTTAFSSVNDRFGGVDILVNNAFPARAVAHDAPAADVDLETWDAVLHVGLRGALLCSRAAIARFLLRGGGTIVNISAVHAHRGDPQLTAYPVAKAGLLALTRAIATQYGRFGVRCNSVSLGTIPYPFQSEEWRTAKLRHQLVGRAGLPEDAANVVAFLASPASSFVTGADLVADGGVLAHLPAYADPETRFGQDRNA
jgi:NAD(P)-dependent dehydrogenase (short-subunit alcohol dehydrogenase family)